MTNGRMNMTILRSFRFPDAALRMLKEIADRKHEGNQTQALIEAIERYHEEMNPVSVEGYVRIDRMKDRASKTGCAACGQSSHPVRWVAIRSDGTVKAGFCDECVEAGRV